MDLVLQVATGIFIGGLGLIAFVYGAVMGWNHKEWDTVPVHAILCFCVPLLIAGVTLWIYG